ncbi:F-box/LRR-repeat protein [Melia azedarach]|uniref:F-box/LRR-repeat protein n=1 Tax=Melia azedarach TaxID=155640 RepID=A0ACC1YP70_MELAZ|nr:F-box/LRR-repeat protein [Melia azedarach]
MEHLPVEVIGNILSRLGGARDVVIASATCKKWREAYRKHLHTLSFNSNEWPGYHDLTTTRLEILITQTIFQTSGLQGLSILMDEVDEFSASTVIAWLMYTRETLRRLFYNVRTTPNVNILEVCGRQKLEVLELAHNSITGVEPYFQRFPCLKSLSLSYVSISALDLSLFLTACQKIETLELINPEIAMSDTQVTVELTSPTLKSIYVEAISLDKFILEADSIERLHLKDCALELFELVGKGTLKHFKIDDVSVIHLDIGDTVDNLEIVDVSNFTIIWPKFSQMISRSSKLKKLRLWDVVFDEDEIVDLETIAVCFPKLSHLSLSYDLRDGVFHYGLQGSTYLENVVVLELGWPVIHDLFSHWVEGLLKRCTNLKKLVIFGVVSEIKTHEECLLLANFTSSIVHLMRKYLHVEVEFEYE